jgi:hypothetical protein
MDKCWNLIVGRPFIPKMGRVVHKVVFRSVINLVGVG